MSKSITITVPVPCHESWQGMTALEKGKFCASCQKKVHDLTQLSDREIASILSKDKEACGRLLPSQLNRELILPTGKGSLWLAAGAAVMGFLALASSQAVAQTTVPTEQREPLPAEALGKMVAVQPRTIRGTIYDDTEVPLPGATILNKSLKLERQADIDGKFSIEAYEDNILELSYVGYNTITYKVDDKDSVTIIFTETDGALTGEIIFYPKRTFFGRIFRSVGNWFR
jgi:hypothetical protein